MITGAVPFVKVPLLDLQAQFRQIRGEVLSAIEEVCEAQSFVLGPRVEAFETAIAGYLECRHAVGVASGSDALLLSLMAAGVNPGDEVITVPFTFFSTAGGVSRLHAVPVFVDVLPDTFTMDPEQLEQKITSRTKAIIPVHLFGQCADMESIMEVADRRGVKVIEDACQSIGASRHGIKAGTFGYSGCFSFFPSKNLGGVGDGGLIVTNDGDALRTVACVAGAWQPLGLPSRPRRAQQPARCLGGGGVARQTATPGRMERQTRPERGELQ